MIYVIICLACFVIGIIFGRYVNKLDRQGEEARKNRLNKGG